VTQSVSSKHASDIDKPAQTNLQDKDEVTQSKSVRFLAKKRGDTLQKTKSQGLGSTQSGSKKMARNVYLTSLRPINFASTKTLETTSRVLTEVKSLQVKAKQCSFKEV